jgi:hypothetical protein
LVRIVELVQQRYAAKRAGKTPPPNPYLPRYTTASECIAFYHQLETYNHINWKR